MQYSAMTVLAMLMITSCGAASAATPIRNDIFKFRGTGPGYGNANESGLAVGKDGQLYGATGAGYNKQCNSGFGCGIIYELTLPKEAGSSWVGKTLYQFKGKTDGAYPNETLLIGADGSLYGASQRFTGSNTDTSEDIYRLSPPVPPSKTWTFQTIWSEKSTYGQFLFGRLVQDKLGNLYGTDQATNTVFELSPPAASGGAWRHRDIAHTSGAPQGVTFDENGNLFGTTYTGGTGLGSIYELKPPANSGGAWTYELLYSFTGGTDGAYPGGPLTVNGAGTILYGSTYNNTGGCQPDCGKVFILSRKGKVWVETTILTLDGSQGSFVGGPLLVGNKGSTIYGVASFGNSTNTICGSVFQLTYSASADIWNAAYYGFTPNAGSCNPVGNLVLDALGSGVYGTASTVFGSVFLVQFP